MAPPSLPFHPLRLPMPSWDYLHWWVPTLPPGRLDGFFHHENLRGKTPPPQTATFPCRDHGGAQHYARKAGYFLGGGWHWREITLDFYVWIWFCVKNRKNFQFVGFGNKSPFFFRAKVTRTWVVQVLLQVAKLDRNDRLVSWVNVSLLRGLINQLTGVKL